MERIEIAGVRIDVDLPSGVFQDRFHHRYGRFSGASGVASHVFRGSESLLAGLVVHAIEVFTRSAVTLGVLEGGGCLFHAAGVVVDGLAYLFPGTSGAGKTTLASLAQAPLSDEICAVIPAEDGFVVHATPWWNGCAKSAPLAGIYALSWNGEGLVSLPRVAGLRHLTSQIVLTVDEPDTRTAAFRAAARIAAATPFGRLSFTRQTDIDALLRSGRAAA